MICSYVGPKPYCDGCAVEEGCSFLCLSFEFPASGDLMLTGNGGLSGNSASLSTFSSTYNVKHNKKKGERFEPTSHL